MRGTFRFLHAADVHLDSPMRGIARYAGAPVERLRSATRRAYSNLVDLAIEREVAFVLLCGDLYDGDWRDYNTGLFFVAETARLSAAGIDTYIVAGNHDAQSLITRSLRLPERVTVFATAEAETHRDEARGVALHGQGFADRKVARNLAEGYPPALAGYFNIGLLHTSLDGREGHATYAPCKVDDLLAKGYDYWALGHVHRREIVRERPWIVFPGNVQGRNVRETGAKGCTEVSVVEGAVESLQAHALDVCRWRVGQVDASGAEDVDEVIDRAVKVIDAAAEAEDRDVVVVRLRVSGECSVNNALRADAERFASECRAHALSGGVVCVEKIQLATREPGNAHAALERDDAVGELLRSVRDLGVDDASLGAVAEDMKALLAKLPAEMKQGPGGIDANDPAWLAGVLEDARAELLVALLEPTSQ